MLLVWLVAMAVLVYSLVAAVTMQRLIGISVVADWANVAVVAVGSSSATCCCCPYHFVVVGVAAVTAVHTTVS